MKRLILLSIAITAGALTQSEPRIGWRGIVPLRSTRTQVERELGSFDLRCQCYKTENELVRIKYANGPCTGGLPGWNVPAETVLSITVSPNKESAFSELDVNKENFVKTTDHTYTTYYGDGNRGIRYSVSASGFVTDVSYVPSIKDNNLRCAGFPLTDGGVTAYAPYYEFNYETLDDITSRIGEFGLRLRNSPDYTGYVIVYAAQNRKVPGVEGFANTARNYLINDLDTDPKTIQAINGGYREQPTVELFLIPSKWPAPVPTPTFGGILK